VNQNFLRLYTTSFDELLKMITPRIEKKEYYYARCYSSKPAFVNTLRYLAAGNTLEDLKFTSAISPQSIGIIVLETCTALIHSLKDYIKVRKRQ
jgi:hypothetical protein